MRIGKLLDRKGHAVVTVGPEATGIYAACMTVALFSNPLILGISNALAPRTAQAFTEGAGGARRGTTH